VHLPTPRPDHRLPAQRRPTRARRRGRSTHPLVRVASGTSSLTFGAGGRHALRHQVQGWFGMAVSSGALWLLGEADLGRDGGALRRAEVAVLTTANVVATGLRFVAVRVWVFVGPAARPLRVAGSAGAGYSGAVYSGHDPTGRRARRPRPDRRSGEGGRAGRVVRSILEPWR
jgi:hypothetical protein